MSQTRRLAAILAGDVRMCLNPIVGTTNRSTPGDVGGVIGQESLPARGARSATP
jgi:hypothetical protein